MYTKILYISDEMNNRNVFFVSQRFKETNYSNTNEYNVIFLKVTNINSIC